MKCCPPLPVTLVTLISLGSLAAQPTPEGLYQAAIRNPHLHNTSGEQFTWHFSSRAGDFLDAYLGFGREDEAWLEQAVRYYDWGIEKGISNDPDGYPGTIGAGIREDLRSDDTKFVHDTLVGDANMARYFLRFAEIVLNDPELEARFGDKAREYVDLAHRMVYEKWNQRDCFYTDARGLGSYHTHPFVIDRDNRDEWVPMPNRIISDNLNKHYKAADVLVRLYRITGKTEYRDQAMAVFARAKAMFRLFPEEDRIVFNFWMPHGPYDMRGTTPSSWVGVHPNRAGYQAYEVSSFLEAYNTGLIFSEEDIRRLAETNVWMMENGFPSADGTSDAGTLWGGLAQVDDRIYEAYERELEKKKDEIGLAYLRNVIGPRRGFGRVFVDNPSEVIVTNIPVQPGRHIGLATAIPDVVEVVNNDRIKLVSRLYGEGPITLRLLDQGGRPLGTLVDGEEVGERGHFHTFIWDGTNPGTGNKDYGAYLVEWTFKDEVRTWPVFVRAGEPREDDGSPKALQPGQTLAYDFESPLDPRWQVVQAGLSSEKSGSGALRVGRKEQAKLVFGDVENLPVRIEFSLHDGGVQAKPNASGAAWGLQLASGDTFALAQRWRGYLDGNRDLAWVNTGENQWFTLHPSGLGRETGWNRWVFDFTDPENPVVSRNGKELRMDRVPATLRPDGAVALTFFGTEMDGTQADQSTLFIDDLTVTYPAE